MKKKMLSLLLVMGMIVSLVSTVMAQDSDFVETEQPELTEETKQLISLYQKNPTEENYINLRSEVIKNYDAVLERKEGKLDELKLETAGKPGGEDKVAEMEEIVQEMYLTYWDRINSNMLRFSDSRLLKWKTADAAQYEYIPVMGAGDSIYVKYTSVTNEEYAKYIKATGAKAPANWIGGTYTEGESDFPVNDVSYQDAYAYCQWLTACDGVNTYRLPTESEWELAAGHMPKDAEFNCGINDGRTPVDQYAGITRGAHGAIDFWGNVWEWTSTQRSITDDSVILGVKGGSWSSDRTDCRTEYRDEGRDSSLGYDDVGFRVIKVLNGEEPEKSVNLTTLGIPAVKAYSGSEDSVTLSWTPVAGSVIYQVYEYFEETGLVSMVKNVSGTSTTINNLQKGNVYRYIVQAVSYQSTSDNVSGDNSIAVTCGGLLGDINFDGEVNVYDMEECQRHILGIKVLLPNALTVGDINYDGIMDVRDIEGIQKVILNI